MRKWSPSVVFPVPGPPLTRYDRPEMKPPQSTSSRPATPVDTRSVDFFFFNLLNLRDHYPPVCACCVAAIYPPGRRIISPFVRDVESRMAFSGSVTPAGGSVVPDATPVRPAPDADHRSWELRTGLQIPSHRTRLGQRPATTRTDKAGTEASHYEDRC